MGGEHRRARLARTPLPRTRHRGLLSDGARSAHLRAAAGYAYLDNAAPQNILASCSRLPRIIEQTAGASPAVANQRKFSGERKTVKNLK